VVVVEVVVVEVGIAGEGIVEVAEVKGYLILAIKKAATLLLPTV
jgi:hypothetical protein